MGVERWRPKCWCESARGQSSSSQRRRTRAREGGKHAGGRQRDRRTLPRVREKSTGLAARRTCDFVPKVVVLLLQVGAPKRLGLLHALGTVLEEVVERRVIDAADRIQKHPLFRVLFATDIKVAAKHAPRLGQLDLDVLSIHWRRQLHRLGLGMPGAAAAHFRVCRLSRDCCLREFVFWGRAQVRSFSLCAVTKHEIFYIKFNLQALTLTTFTNIITRTWTARVPEYG